jgi:hypothetical protein
MLCLPPPDEPPSRANCFERDAAYRASSKRGEGMQPATLKQRMFRTAFDCERAERAALIDFMKFLSDNDVQDTLPNHPLGPSSAWLWWGSESFIGFGPSRVLLQTGHRFAISEPTKRYSRKPWAADDWNLSKMEREFRKHYPAFVIPEAHRQLHALHPVVYLRTAEAVALSGLPMATSLLEIGAGADVHVAYRHLLNPAMKTTVIDLPEAICVGYVLLRTLGITVDLPQQTTGAAVTMRLPSQEVGGSYDFVFNMGSFQEMNIDTVNRYIALAHKLLLPGGRLQSLNLKQSKQFADTRDDRFDLRAFSSVSRTPTPLHDAITLRREWTSFSTVAIK